MKAVIVNFRGGPRTRYNREVIVRPRAKIEWSLIGRKVIWRDERFSNRIIGKIVDAHGGDRYRARFSKGLPGWAIGSEVEIL
jgi:ribosomal protein L35AE/L33A